MKLKTCVVGPNSLTDKTFFNLLQKHSSFGLAFPNIIDISVIPRTKRNIFDLSDLNDIRHTIAKRTDFVFSIYSPDSDAWKNTVNFFVGQNVPVIAYSGIPRKGRPALSINISTKDVVTYNMRHKSYNRGFCITSDEVIEGNYVSMILLAEIAVMQGYIGQYQSKVYQ